MSRLSGKQIIGSREAQEDSFRLVHQSQQDPNGDVLMLLADGMGGHVGGEVASALALASFEDQFINRSTSPRPRVRLEEALGAANAAIGERIAQEPSLRGMGCTLIGALRLDDRLLWISVGDSILFLFRGGRLRRLNADHSLFGELLELVRAGRMTLSEAEAHPRRNALRSALIGEPLTLVDLNGISLERGDLLLLATDGIETLADDEIARILSQGHHEDVRGIASDLLNAVEAHQARNQDNTTVILYRHASGASTAALGRDSRWRLTSGVERPAWMRAAVIVGGLAVVSLLAFLGTNLLRSPAPVPALTPPQQAETPAPDAPLPAEERPLPRDEAQRAETDIQGAETPEPTEIDRDAIMDSVEEANEADAGDDPSADPGTTHGTGETDPVPDDTAPGAGGGQVIGGDTPPGQVTADPAADEPTAEDVTAPAPSVDQE